jgi:hypothetical protein
MSPEISDGNWHLVSPNHSVDHVGDTSGIRTPSAMSSAPETNITAPPQAQNAEYTEDVATGSPIYAPLPKRRGGRAAIYVVAGLAAAGGGTAFAMSSSSSNKAGVAGADVATTIPLTPAEQYQINQELTVDQPSVDCVQVVQMAHTGNIVNLGNTNDPVYGVQPHIGALDGLVSNTNHPGPRLWSDAIEGPLPNPSDASGSLEVIEATLCQDALFGTTTGNGLANWTVDGVKLGDLNPWLKADEFDASAPVNDIQVRADSYFPIKNSDGSETQTIQSNQAYQLYAEEEITLLNRMVNEGEGTHQTTENYYLSGAGLSAWGTPNVSLNSTQYRADAIWLDPTKKTGECMPEFGFNTKDMRPETEEEQCEVPAATTTTPEKKPTTTTHIPNHPVTTTTGRRGTTTTTVRPTTTTTGRPVTTTTVRPTTTTTTKIGPKPPAHPPVGGGEPTTVPPPPNGGEGVSSPTTSTTSTTQPEASPPTTFYIPPTTSTTTPPGSGTNFPN